MLDGWDSDVWSWGVTRLREKKRGPPHGKCDPYFCGLFHEQGSCVWLVALVSCAHFLFVVISPGARSHGCAEGLGGRWSSFRVHSILGSILQLIKAWEQNLWKPAYPSTMYQKEYYLLFRKCPLDLHRDPYVLTISATLTSVPLFFSQ